MDATFSNFPFLDWRLIFSHLAHVAAAYALALPLAWDREQESRSAGLRTFPLVAVASCGFILLGSRVLADSPESLSRIVQGLMTGIGFIGGGAILKEGASVRGTATAASIWNTGAIGASVALGRYEIAVVLSLINFLTLRWLTPLKQKLKDDGGGSHGA
jgi:putative Mg2+ transporter-C (MgtC) family protein